MEVTMYRPDNGEEAQGLLAETREFLMDSRVSSVAVALSGEEPSTDRSEAENALHGWRKLLPSETTEWLTFRLTYGWTEAEVRAITTLIRALWATFLHLSMDPGFLLSGTRESLRRQAERINELKSRWEQICW